MGDALSPVRLALGAILLVRLAEAWISRLNGERLDAAGVEETGQELHAWTQLFHAGWLGALVVLADEADALDAPWAAAGALLLAARARSLWSARRTWTLRRFEAGAKPDPWARLRDLDGAPLLAEAIVLPLAFGLGWLALAGALACGLLCACRCGLLPRRG